MGLGLFEKKDNVGDKNATFLGGTLEKEKGNKSVSPHKYRVIYNRKYCVGGDICTFVDTERFVLAKDGKADMKGAVMGEDGKFVMEVEDPGMNDIGNPLRRAADSCPAGVIRVIRIRDGTLVAGS